MRALICGYGSAGQRHHKLLQKRGIECDIYDPQKISTVPTGSPAGYDLCVIASPPDQHLHQLRNCAFHDVPTLVEKPLCSFYEGIEIEYGKVSVAYNYRYHPAIKFLKENDRTITGTLWELRSEQYRPSLPSWGLLLDHLPHTLDILLFLSGQVLEVKSVVERSNSFRVTGFLGTDKVIITDIVSIETKIDKFAYVLTPWAYSEIETDTSMFDLMWDDFLAGNYTGLNDAKAIQQALNKVKELVTQRRVVAL